MWTFFVRGGPIMYPLLICSLISLAIIVERIIFWLDAERGRDKFLISEILRLTERGLYEEAAQRVKDSKDYIARVLMGGIVHRNYSLSQAMEMGAEEEIKRMKKNLNILDTIITLAPLLGILGTVIGIINSFHLLGAAGIESPRVVTEGIAQALITTATGLAIAIMTLIPYNYFLSRIERATREMEKFASSLELTFERQRNLMVPWTSDRRKDEGQTGVQ
ncbi:MAG: MotA/TolQ/ExbB proton channel family protein [Deltaproteobacteria bacterium]|nr:MotA/TolQ/ExbB proton channel family protein [Deltaproteobacteria bacterium]